MQAASAAATHICRSPEETFALGEQIGSELAGGEILLLNGGLGAGKTLFTKGVTNAFGFDVDEVTSPTFTLVNIYPTQRLRVYHIDLWRLEKQDAAAAVGLDEILDEETNIVIIEWPDRLISVPTAKIVFQIQIDGDGDEPRCITIRREGHRAEESRVQR
jgi:tRNA threonylcarbamoyladenosine biosynthesis protein TsaE